LPSRPVLFRAGKHPERDLFLEFQSGHDHPGYPEKDYFRAVARVDVG
jgi:hypothetical protein